MKTLFILNEAPYGGERSYNALRMAGALSRRPGEQVRVFLMGDAATCAAAGQKVPAGHYNVESLLGALARHGAGTGVCGSCMDARGIDEQHLAAGTHRGSMEELADWSLWAERTLVF